MRMPIQQTRLSPFALATLALGLVAPVAMGQLFSPMQLFYAGSSARAVAASDLDGDGRIDLAVALYGESTIAVMRNNGDGTFAWALYGVGGSGSVALAMGDLDSDGDTDIAVLRLVGDALCVLFNDGAGGFTARTDYATRASPQSLAIADIENDDDLDIIVANGGDDSVTIFRNLGRGTFQVVAHPSVGGLPRSIAAADLNGDDLPEIITANYSSQNVSVLLNQGGGQFDRNDAVFGVPGPASSIGVGDVNGDGALDLAVAAGGKTSLLLGLGNATFAPYVPYDTGPGTEHLTIGDFDLDGDLDIAAANPGSADIRMLMNLGDGTFALGDLYDSAPTPESIAAADLDGDTDVELLVPNTSYVGVLTNRSFEPPVLDTDPTSLLLPVGGGSAQFSVSASGGLLNPWFQWRRDGEPLTDGGSVQGALTPTLTIQATDPDIGLYDCVVSNPGGEAASGAAVLGIRPNPCRADTNDDGVINTLDLIAYLNLWTAGCP